MANPLLHINITIVFQRKQIFQEAAYLQSSLRMVESEELGNVQLDMQRQVMIRFKAWTYFNLHRGKWFWVFWLLNWNFRIVYTFNLESYLSVWNYMLVYTCTRQNWACIWIDQIIKIWTWSFKSIENSSSEGFQYHKTTFLQSE